ncbi:hypothetical protein HGM15179_002395 [Zosterops borbonicus]|uniref:Uncharacterized protein n=1 Tax=Zosterops borbonicus TaxID=364589 RepID=A0A8K1LT38_9PASS|nr:hypothetical protein HGM15179_002395 [Zosterops borbonicus]
MEPVMILQADFLGNVNIMFITPAQTIEYECRKAGGAFLALLGEDRLVSDYADKTVLAATQDQSKEYKKSQNWQNLFEQKRNSALGVALAGAPGPPVGLVMEDDFSFTDGACLCYNERL